MWQSSSQLDRGLWVQIVLGQQDALSNNNDKVENLEIIISPNLINNI